MDLYSSESIKYGSSSNRRLSAAMRDIANFLDDVAEQTIWAQIKSHVAVTDEGEPIYTVEVYVHQ